jgi:dUTP pyrophosphatase
MSSTEQNREQTILGLRYDLVDKTGPRPEYATDGSAAFDLATRESAVILPREISRLPSNLIVSVPTGYVLILSLRSSTPSRYGLLMPHGIGIIDHDFCGRADEILIQVLNFTDQPVTLERGTRLAQALLVRHDRLPLIRDHEPSEAARGGFGSTGT